MCGIAGIVGPVDPDRAADVRQAVGRMTEALRHRGPDDGGLCTLDVHGGVGALGHRRLAILDPSPAGHQPMTRERCTMVYNGEIYNYRQLRSELPGPFASNSDTEVVLALYLRYGPAFVDRLVGMFSFAIWDEPRQRLFAARDRLGIKPFVYQEVEGGGLAFASEIKALLELGRPSIDRSALRDFFTYKYVPTPKTIYQGICKLPPAHTLTFDGRLHVERYWQATSSTRITDPDLAFDQFESLLEEVVNDHMLSDVPVGVFFSGGIDSSAVAASLEQPRTFTLGFDVKSHDESEIASRIAEHLGTRHRSLRASGGDLDEALEAMPRIYDEPFGDHGAWAMRMIAGLAVKDVKVALTGEGGDELFAGYHWYDKWTRSRASPWWRVAARLLPPLTQAARSAERRGARGLGRYAMFLGPFTPRQKRALLSPELMADDDYDDLWFFRQHWRPELEEIKRVQWMDLHTYLSEDMLTKVDRATMAVSLEARPPFVDHRMVAFALSLDGPLLHGGGHGKLLSRRYLAPRLPPGTLDRPKIGFSMPVRRWVGRKPELMDAALARLAREGVLRSARRTRFTNEQTWSLLVLDRFLAQQPA